MDYRSIYNRIIERARKRLIYEDTEYHHIIPKSEGGSNKKTNQVELTRKEHHICHLLLLKMGKCKSYRFAHISSREYIRIKTREKEEYAKKYKRLRKVA